MTVCLPVGVDDKVMPESLPVGVDDTIHADDRVFTCWCR